MDFEEAMANAFLDVFTNCTLWRDFFLFQQANVRQLAKLKLAEHTSAIVEDIRNLGTIWSAKSCTFR